MNLRAPILASTLLIFLAIFNFSYSFYPARAESSPIPTPAICVGHGGPNCSIINPDASVICNDGTIDETYFIYAATECQKDIYDRAEKESALMEKTGCFPPSEITCINNESYKNLYLHLARTKTVDSELGKMELRECINEINEYGAKYKEYKQCLLDNNISEPTLPGDRLVLPIMKSIFCPIFYGNKASYDSDLDLCVCDIGYFKYNSKCESGPKICQEKYSPDSIFKNGSCSKPSTTPTENSSPITNLRNPYPTGSIGTNPYSPTPRPPQLMFIDEPSVQPVENERPNIIKSILNSITSKIREILNLFNV